MDLSQYFGQKKLNPKLRFSSVLQMLAAFDDVPLFPTISQFIRNLFTDFFLNLYKIITGILWNYYDFEVLILAFPM
nr:hypothetical protein [Ectobacillus panaciterrae]